VTTPAKRIGTLHVITDTAVQSRYGHAALAAMAIEGGADSIQLRDKRLSFAELLAVAGEVLAVCRSAGVPLIVNDRVGIALEARADGVHLGRTDATIEDARAALGPQAIIGGTAHSEEELIEVAGAGADYVGLGHIFPTTSKRKESAPLGLEALRRACRRVTIPVVAVGGIEVENAARVIEAGAWGIAVIAAVCRAEDPQAATRSLREAITGAVRKRQDSGKP